MHARTVRVVIAGAVAVVTVALVGATSAGAAKKLNACTIVPQAKLETATGSTYTTPEDTSIGPVKASCRFPSESGDDLNLFLTNDVKGGIKDSIGSYFATKESFQKIYGQATPVNGAGKAAYTAFDGSSSLPQGSILVLDGKNHAALMVFTGDGVTADNVIEHGKAVAAIVLPKIK